MGGWGGAGKIITPSRGTGGEIEQKIPQAWDIKLYEGIHRITHAKHLEMFEKSLPEKIQLSEEYAGRIIHSIFTDTRRKMSLNVRNVGMIPNLAEGCVVEVPTYVDAKGIQPQPFGKLPSQCAALCQRNVDVQSCVIDAIENESVDSILHAMMLDPLTGACLEPLQIQDMLRDMIAAEPQRLPRWMVS
jgi:alpha-galactosidase